MYDYEQLKSLAEEHENRHWQGDFLNRHRLQGVAYHKTQDKVFYPQWENQLNSNLMIKSELEKIGKDLNDEMLDACLLKGFSLLGDVYQDWGQRYTSDVDLLVSLPNLWRISDILNLHGYRKVAQRKWLGNRFKFMFLKTIDEQEIKIEVHTQLFWHTKLNWRQEMRSSNIVGFKQLSLEKQLLHLCGHLGFQHSFAKLLSLVDIFYFMKQYQDQIHWQQFWNLAIEHRLYKSAAIAFHLVKRLGGSVGDALVLAPERHSSSMWMLKKMVDLQYLHNPQRMVFRGFLIKNLIKDSFIQNMIYWFFWSKEKLQSLKTKKPILRIGSSPA